VHHRYGVQIDLAALPDDADVLQRMLREVVPELQAENEKLLLLIQVCCVIASARVPRSSTLINCSWC